jgi:hypothetical protein
MRIATQLLIAALAIRIVLAVAQRDNPKEET